MVAAPLGIRLFGPFDAWVNGSPLPRLRTRKGQWLLALLTLRQGCEVERGWLAGTLWPDSPEPQALLSLRISLKDLRHALGPEAVRLRSPTSRTLLLDLAGAAVDVLAFDAAIALGEPASLEEAVSLYRGPLLEGCLEEWVLAERQAREEAYLGALERLARHERASGDLTAAVGHLRRVVSTDPHRETAQRALMEALAASGSFAAATEVYRDLRLRLHQELNAEPDPTTRALFQEIRTRARGLGEGTGHSDVQAFRRSGVQEGPTSSDLNARTPECLNALAPAHRFTSLSEEAEEPVGGAVPLGSEFYVVRPTDERFHKAIARRDSIVLVKGARQMGKTSLLGRGLQQAREMGAQVVLTDCEMLNGTHFLSAEAFFLAVGAAIADQLALEVFPDAVWDPRFGASMNFDRYLRRHVLGKADVPIVWGLDGVDRLASCDFRNDVFGLFRSWHNQRVTDPGGPWSRLTLVIAYATEAHLLITDADQSPFNVGTTLILEDFTREQVEDLNRRHGSPLRDGDEVTRFWDLVGGHPHLVRVGLHEMAGRGLGIGEIEAEAAYDDGPFGASLRRLLVVLGRSPELAEALRGMLQGQPCPTGESFYRLRSAGLICGHSAREARLRCRLYAAYLERHLL